MRLVRKTQILRFSGPTSSELKLEKVELGKGKRVIGKGGHFDPKYNLSVPKIREGGSFSPEDGP